MARVIMLMGVSGFGKTTIGKKLATQLQVPFLLQSQFDILEVPSYGIHINISENPDHIVSEIIEKLYSNV